MLVQRHAAINQLLSDTAELGVELRSLITRNGAQLSPLLGNLATVSAVSGRRQDPARTVHQVSGAVLDQHRERHRQRAVGRPAAAGLLEPDNVIAACGTHPTPGCGARMTRPIRLFAREQWLVLRQHRRLAIVITGTVILALAAVTVVFTVVFGGGPHADDPRAIPVRLPACMPTTRSNILGVRTGTVTSVRAHGAYVEVTMRLPAHVRIPTDARAILMAPNPVSDRTVELYPPYTGGPVMKSGTEIPSGRTSAPLGVDADLRAGRRPGEGTRPGGREQDRFAVGGRRGTCPAQLRQRPEAAEHTRRTRPGLPALTRTRRRSAADHQPGPARGHVGPAQLHASTRSSPTSPPRRGSWPASGRRWPRRSRNLQSGLSRSPRSSPPTDGDRRGPPSPTGHDEPGARQ